MAIRRSSRVVTVSIPPGAARDFERIADEEGRNKSELFRETLRVYRDLAGDTAVRVLGSVTARPGPAELVSRRRRTSSE